MNKSKVCEIYGCNKPVIAKNLCNSHYRKNIKYGNPEEKRQSSKDDIRMFLAQALKSNHDQCIPWPFGMNGAGYGVFQKDGTKWLAHRYIATEKHGPPPSDSHDAAHAPIKCHNRSCINPNHVFWATRKENLSHRKDDGTFINGDDHASTVVSDADVKKIRNSKKSQSDLAKEYKVSQPHISKIKNMKRRA